MPEWDAISILLLRFWTPTSQKRSISRRGGKDNGANTNGKMDGLARSATLSFGSSNSAKSSSNSGFGQKQRRFSRSATATACEFLAKKALHSRRGSLSKFNNRVHCMRCSSCISCLHPVKTAGEWHRNRNMERASRNQTFRLQTCSSTVGRIFYVFSARKNKQGRLIRAPNF